MNKKRNCLTIACMVLTLTIGLTTINSISLSSDNKAYALENKVHDTIKKQCPSYEKLNGIKGLASNAIGACLVDKLPASNDNTAVLVITSILRANCNWLTGCPVPDGIIFYNKGERVFQPDTYEAGGTEKFYIRMPVGATYTIDGKGASSTGIFTFELANIQGDCVGQNTCKSTMGPNGAQVTVNFHYKRNL